MLRPLRRPTIIVSTIALLAGCSSGEFDPATQIGANPTLPEPQQNLLPDLKVAEVIGWGEGQTPTAPEGLE